MKKTMKCFLALFCLAVLLAACAPAQAVRPLAREDTPRLLILTAFAPELSQMRKNLQEEQRYVLAGRTYTLGRLEGHAVVLASSGESMVNAAMATQAALDAFNIHAILFSGIAGGVNPALNIGDVVVPAQWGQYQEQVFARQTAQGWDTGFYAQEFGHYGMMFPQRVPVASLNGQPDAEESLFWFKADPALLAAAGRAVAVAKLERCSHLGACLDHDPRVVVGGNGVSGPTFVDNADYRAWAWQTFQADALDMETAAMAQVAYANGVPFIAFRSLSDLAGGGAGGNELVTFLQVAADNSASMVTAFLNTWEGD